MTTEQQNIGEKVVVVSNGQPPHEMVGQVEVYRVGQPQSVRLIPGIITAVQEHEVEVIHSHSTFGYLPLILVKPFLRVPMVTHVHATTAGWLHASPRAWRGNDPLHLRDGLTRERFFYSKVDRLVAVSQSVARELECFYGIDRRRIRVVQNAVDANLFKPLPKSGAKAKLGWEGKRTILFVGRPSPMKGLEQLLRAMNLVLRRLSDVQLVLVGGSPKFIGRNGIPLDFLISSVVEDEFRDRIRIAGPVPNTSLPEYYSAADVYVIPSIYEASPKTLLEAMACGTVAVATRVGGIPEVIKSGFNGYLVEPGDPVALANSLLAALSDDATSVSCADAALETIRRNYTWRRVVESLSTVYDEIIAEKRQGEIRATLPRDSGAGGRPPRGLD